MIIKPNYVIYPVLAGFIGSQELRISAFAGISSYGIISGFYHLVGICLVCVILVGMK